VAERYLFFNSIDVDRRRYGAQDFADYFGSVLSTGVLHTDEEPGLMVSVEQGTMNTVIQPGKSIMKGHLYENTTPLTLTHSIPEATTDRIDRIVLRLDLRQSERNIMLHVKEGDNSTNPTPPALQRDELIYEISLAQIYVHRGTSTLQPVDLVDERLDEELCGLVSSLISIPSDQLQTWILAKIDDLNIEADEFEEFLNDLMQRYQDRLAQWEQDWQDWFNDQQSESFILQNEKGQPGGVPELDENGEVPIGQLPPMNYVPTTEKGAPGGVATLDSSGNVKQSVPNLGNPKYVQTFTSSGTWTKPSDITTVYVEVLGAGGGGGGAHGYTGRDRRAGAGGGGGGALSIGFFKASDLLNTVTITVGAGGQGGAPGSTSGENGTTGGQSSFVSGGISISASGGRGGRGTVHSTNSVNGGPGAPHSSDIFNSLPGGQGSEGSNSPSEALDTLMSAPGGGSGVGVGSGRDWTNEGSPGGTCLYSGLPRRQGASGYGRDGLNGTNSNNWIAGSAGSGGTGGGSGYTGGNGGNGGRGAGGAGGSVGYDGGGRGGNGGNGCVRIWAW